MKKVILIISIAGIVLLNSCSNQPECNSNEAKKLVLDIVNDNINMDVNARTYRFMLKYEIIASQFGLKKNQIKKERIKTNKFLFFKNGSGIVDAVRTTSKEDKLNSCSCEGEVTLSEEAFDNLKKRIFEINPDGSFNFSQLRENLRVEISYDLQITNDGELYAEVNLDEKLADVFFVFSVIKELISEAENRVFENTFYQSSSGESGYLINSIEDNKIKIEFSTVERDDYPELIATFENGKIILDELPENVEIENDEFFILSGENLKVYSPETNNYITYTKY